MSSDAVLAQQLQDAEAHGQSEAPAHAVAVKVEPGTSDHYPVVQAQQSTIQPAVAVPANYVSQAMVAQPPPRSQLNQEGQIGIQITGNVSDRELIVLNYRYSVRCFAMIDIIFTVLNLFSRREIYVYAALILIVGPVCGWIGAKRLNRSLIGVYLGFSVLKALYEIVCALLLPSLWMLLLGLVQIWISKIIYTFWVAIGWIQPDRLQQLRTGELQEQVQAQITRVYW